MKKLATLLLLALLFYTPANAQPNDPLKLIYKSQEGVRPAAGLQSAQGGMSGFSNRLDATGDGNPDLVLTSEDSRGNILELLVIDGTSLGAALIDTIYWIQDVPQTLGLAEKDGMKFYGFADADADNFIEVIFASEEDVLLFDLSDNSLEWAYSVFIPDDFPVLLIGVTDITHDGFADIIIFLPQTRQVEVWGNPQ